MKVTRKLGKLSSLMAAPPEGDDGEIAPSLMLNHLPKEIEGMPEKGDFEGHVKGKVRRHSSTTEDGKTHHSYDLDVHHFECHCPDKKGGSAKPAAKKRKSDKEELDEAFDKHFGKKD